MSTKALSHHAEIATGRDRRPLAAVIRFAFDRFLLLPLGAAIAVIWANTAGDSYFTFAHRASFVVNEVGMALFFGLLTQEVLEATMVGGALHTWRRWSVAIVAAFGGIVGSALVYLAYLQWSYETLLLNAWPVATAVDAAAAYYILKIIAPRSGLLPFVLLLALVTNVFGMLVVGLQHAALMPRGGGAALLLLAVSIASVLRNQNVLAFWPYLAIAGPLSWLAFYAEGLHPAFSLIPIVLFLPHEPRSLELFTDPPDDDAVHHYEHEWNVGAQIVLFFFGLVNAGILVRWYGASTWAVLVSALVGRPAGILIAVGVGVALGLHLPPRVGWRQLVVAALATSSGFTLALFFATGLLPIGPALMGLKFGALLSASGVILTVIAARALHVGIFQPSKRRHRNVFRERLRRRIALEPPPNAVEHNRRVGFESTLQKMSKQPPIAPPLR